MAETLISKRLPEVISNRSAGNGRRQEEPPLPDFQGHFHGHDGEPGRMDVGDASLAIGRTSNEAPTVVSHPVKPALPLGIARRVQNPKQGLAASNPFVASNEELHAAPSAVSGCWRCGMLCPVSKGGGDSATAMR
jgi:hypothetical protein